MIDNGRIEIHDNHSNERVGSGNSSSTGGTETIAPHGFLKMPGKSIFSKNMLASLAVGDVKALRIKPMKSRFMSTFDQYGALTPERPK
ncbi:MAG: hypothetical protein PVF97_11135 [Desulfobacterales bacterium]